MKIALDAHKRYSLCSVEDDQGALVDEFRINHERGSILGYLRRYPLGSPVAVETTGNWYWIVDEIEQAGHEPRLVHARRAKLLNGSVNKTDRIDVQSLNRLQRMGVLPTVWIPSGKLRDQRDLTRTRMYLVNMRTGLKNRIHADLDKYGLWITEVSDIFGCKGRRLLAQAIVQLPEQTRFTVERQLAQIDSLDNEISLLDGRLKEVCQDTAEAQLLRTIPGIGFTFSQVIVLEVGDVSRFPAADRLASYAGTTPRVHASGGRQRFGHVRSDVNRYLKWAYMEAANSVCLNHKRWPTKHVSRLYKRIRQRKGHGTAIGALARHLAESTYWVLTKREPYRDPCLGRVLSTEA
jgi:transposase